MLSPQGVVSVLRRPLLKSEKWRTRHKSLGEKFRPGPLLVQYVKAGRRGRKSGRGVFEYPELLTSSSKT